MLLKKHWVKNILTLFAHKIISFNIIQIPDFFFNFELLNHAGDL